MFKDLGQVEQRLVAIEQSLSRGDLASRDIQRLGRERAEIEPVVMGYRRLRQAETQLAEARELASCGDDTQLQVLAAEEVRAQEQLIAQLRQELILLLLPRDPNDGRGVILEIRAGTGGDEAGLFAGDLLRMYLRYADKMRWRSSVVSETEAPQGGFKEVICAIEGEGVYSKLKFECGVHRVQRVPATEAQGRVHTSACTVAVLPEVDDVEVEIVPSDLKIDTYRASGAGGQHVNTTDSAVRITHLPTGVVAESQAERSQHQNRERAMRMLRSRIYEQLQREQQAKQAASRRSQVGSGDRSERIRTYNFPQGRVSDHRIQLTLYKLDAFLQGDIEPMLEALGAHDTALKLQQVNHRGD